MLNLRRGVLCGLRARPVRAEDFNSEDAGGTAPVRKAPTKPQNRAAAPRLRVTGVFPVRAPAVCERGRRGI